MRVACENKSFILGQMVKSPSCIFFFSLVRPRGKQKCSTCMLKRWPLFYDLIEWLGREMNSIRPITDMVSWKFVCLKTRANGRHIVSLWPGLRSRGNWELLYPFAHLCEHRNNNSQHCWPNNAGSCSVRLHVAWLSILPNKFVPHLEFLYFSEAAPVSPAWRCQGPVSLLFRQQLLIYLTWIWEPSAQTGLQWLPASLVRQEHWWPKETNKQTKENIWRQLYWYTRCNARFNCATTHLLWQFRGEENSGRFDMLC